VRLAIEVAKKIVHREIQADPEIVQTLVHVALSHAAERSPVTVRVHPLDHRAFLDKHPGWAEESGDGREVVIVADKTIERGGCLIQTECGDVDARIEEEFREVERAFSKARGTPDMSTQVIDLQKYVRRLHSIDPVKTVGAVRRAVGIVVESQGPPASVGELCEIIGSGRLEAILPR